MGLFIFIIARAPVAAAAQPPAETGPPLAASGGLLVAVGPPPGALPLLILLVQLAVVRLRLSAVGEAAAEEQLAVGGRLGARLVGSVLVVVDDGVGRLVDLAVGPERIVAARIDEAGLDGVRKWALDLDDGLLLDGLGGLLVFGGRFDKLGTHFGRCLNLLASPNRCWLLIAAALKIRWRADEVLFK